MDAAIALNRFGLGARPGEVRRIGGAEEWLARQAEDASAFELTDSELPSSVEAGVALFALREERRASRNGAAQGDPVQQVVMRLAELARPDVEARIQSGLNTDHGFAERLVYFWSNHFTVSAAKGQTAPLVGPFEREAIRAQMQGSFFDLLSATTTHQGMLLYLDQANSVGPNSWIGSRRDTGLNENLAREVLELHTVGVHGGYSQTDVTEFARALTGWTIVGPAVHQRLPASRLGETIFLEQMHEPGQRRIMGRSYSEGGREQALAVLHDLARRPETARRIALKLVRHFIADEPPPSAVARLEHVFLETEGDLPSLHRALAALPEAATPEARKFKSPQDFILSACRMTGVASAPLRGMAGSFQMLAQPIFRAPSPAGWDDVSENWAGPDAIMKRLEWSQALAARVGRRDAPEALAADVLGPGLSDATRAAVARAESAEQGLTLALMSPEFQRR
ncbi:MAG TPA: DUF1800 domain-containing protein [Caulobacterales bacterium]|nr:DUF1800 domain-containing protein [Caulobacterales bacterium]